MGIPHYEAMTVDPLIAKLRSWSPAVRYRASQALKKKDGDLVAKVLPLQDTDPASETYGVWPWLLEEPLSMQSFPVPNRVLSSQNWQKRVTNVTKSAKCIYT